MKTSDMLRNTTAFVLFSILFVPLLFSNQHFFPYISGKNFAFRILVEIAALLYAFLLLKDNSYRPKRSIILTSLFAFVAVMGAATIFSENVYKSFWGNYERMEGFITVLHLGVYVLLLSAVFVKEKTWEWFFEISLFASLIVGANAILDLREGIGRIYGSLGNSTYLGVYALVHIFLAALLLFKLTQAPRNKDSSYWMSFYKYIAFMIFNTYVMYQTGTRGSFVGFVAGVLVISALIAFFEKQRKTLRKVGIAILATTIVVIGLLGMTKNTEFVSTSLLGRYASLITFDLGKVAREQGFGRTLIWNVALQGVKERPIIGWGQESFNYVFNKYYTPDLYGQEQWFDRAHNVFLDWLIAGGILGLLAYLSLYAALLWSVWKSKADHLGVPAKAIITGLVVAYFIHNIFVFDNLASYILFFAILAYGHHLVTDRQVKGVAARREVYYLVGSIAVIVFAFVMYMGNLKPYNANVTLLNALQYQAEFSTQGSPRYNNTAALQDSYDSYVKVFNSNTFASTEAREQIAVGAQTVFTAAPTELRQKVMDLTDAEFKKQFAMTPDDARYYSIYGTYLSRTGRLDESIVVIRRAEELSPGKQTFYFDEAIALINKGSFQEAYTLLQKTYEMATSNPMAQSMLALGAVYARQDAVFEELLKTNPNLITDPRVIQAYIVTKQFQKVIPIIENYISLQPQVSPDTILYLAAAYLESGNRTKALAILADMKTKTTDANLVAEIQYYEDLIKKGATTMLQ